MVSRTTFHRSRLYSSRTTLAGSHCQHTSRQRLRVPTLRILALAPVMLLAQVPAVAAQDLDRGELAERLRTGIAEAALMGENVGLNQMVTLARRAVTAFPNDALLNHYAGYALYRLAGPTMETDMAGALALLADSESFLEKSIEVQPIAESHALLSSVLGMQIVNGVSAMTLGMKSGVQLSRAKALDARNPRVRLLEGISAFHTPKMFGGGIEAATRHFLAAIELFAEDAPKPPLPAWGLAEAYAWLGQAYAEMGKVEEAREAYERALELEPEYGWVRDVLLPGLGGRPERQVQTAERYRRTEVTIADAPAIVLAACGAPNPAAGVQASRPLG